MRVIRLQKDISNNTPYNHENLVEWKEQESVRLYLFSMQYKKRIQNMIMLYNALVTGCSFYLNIYKELSQAHKGQ